MKYAAEQSSLPPVSHISGFCRHMPGDCHNNNLLKQRGGGGGGKRGGGGESTTPPPVPPHPAGVVWFHSDIHGRDPFPFNFLHPPLPPRLQLSCFSGVGILCLIALIRLKYPWIIHAAKLPETPAAFVMVMRGVCTRVCLRARVIGGRC